MFWFLVSIGLVALVYFTMVRPFDYWKKKGVSQHSFWTIWVENLQGFIQYRHIAETIQKTYNEFPNTRYYGLYQLFSPTLAIKDSELIKQIMVKDFDHFVDHFNFAPDAADPLWQKNLFFLKGDQWRDMRTTLSPSFTSSKMKIIFGLMSECAQQFVRHFQDQGTKTIDLEMKDIFTRFANDVIATAAFGVTCDSLKNKDNEFYLMGKKATAFVESGWDFLKLVLIAIFPKIAKIFGLHVFQKDSSEFFRNLIKSNIGAREKNRIVRPDMIHLLLEARRNRSKTENVSDDPGTSETNQEQEVQLKTLFTDDDIAAQAFVFFLAGFDSVATLMYLMAYEIAVNPDVQQRLQDEIEEVQTECRNNFSYEDLSELKYMDMVMSETLRKWPSTMIIDRICVKPYTIPPVRRGEKPVRVNKGDIIWFPLYGIHRDPEYYPEPDRFDPERFSEENKSNNHPYTYLPFGGGPRTCIGMRFALMETKLVFFYLLSKFDITVIERTPIPPVLDRTKLSLDCVGGFWLGLKQRKEMH